MKIDVYTFPSGDQWIAAWRQYKVIGHKKDDPCPKCEHESFCADCGVCSHCGHCATPALDKSEGDDD